MIKIFSVVLLFTFIFSTTFANDYDDAWKAINNKNYAAAIPLLTKALKDPATSMDAFCTLTYLHSYQGKEIEIYGLLKELTSDADKNAYLYAMWFNGAIVGNYGKKAAYQLALLDTIDKDNSFNGSLKAAAHYVKAMHLVFSNQYENAKIDWAQMGTLQQWQFAGPFENISGSGFNYNYGPLNAANGNATFNGMNNIEVKWTVPIKSGNEGWVFCHPFMQQSSATVYAQTFVYVPMDTKVLLNAGVNGAVKIWVNDAIVLSESKERVTELDYYKNYCYLKKGYNRILVQLSYTNNTISNFIIRLTDDKMTGINNSSSTALLQPYSKEEKINPVTSIKHFAETVFENKIKAAPLNFINYVLLSQTYLRNSRITEARQIIEKGLILSPDNPLLKFELIQIFIKAENRTLLLQEVDWLKENDPESYMNVQMNIQTLITGEKYEEANTALNEMIKNFGEDENILQIKARVLGKLEKIDELVKLVDSGYVKYPSNTSFVTMKFQVKKLIEKNNKAAAEVYKTFLKDNYESTIFQNLANEYKEQGDDTSYVAMVNKFISMSAQDPYSVSILTKYYYEKQDYIKALVYAQKANAMAPTVGLYWHNIASTYEQMNNKEAAIANYKKTIYYNRTDYDARKKLTLLLKQQELYKLLPESDVYALVKKSAIVSTSDYSYILDEKGTILYDEGASEEYIEYVIKINNQKGIDTWKELNLSYSNSQSLLVDKCEVIKVSGTKVTAERNDGSIVFTGLQTGDAIHVKYRLQNYSTGRIGRAFWDKFIFNSFANSQSVRYTLIVPKAMLFNAKVINSSLEPSIKEVDDFKIYTWQMKDLLPLKSESLMPPVNDIAAVLHISTIKSWEEIAGWYSDIAYQDITDNYDLDILYKEIFKNNISESNYAKVKRIYDYIVTNIRYSSVSFRQSGYVPQNISKIINTRLGDCKDVASLFVALTSKAGIKASLVLVDTKDNGIKDMLLPSMEFNHCISLVHIDEKDYYIELTNSDLPFGSLPSSDIGALSLIIPEHGQKSTSQLSLIVPVNRAKEKLVRKIKLSVTGNDLNVESETKRYGSIISSWRNTYANLSAEKQKESYLQTLSNDNKNSVKLDTVSFAGLKGDGDSVIVKCKYTIKNELIDAGSMKMIKIPFIDIVASLESLAADTRIYPLQYWNYENTDAYETYIDIQIPSGKTLMEYPADKNFTFKNSTYTLNFLKSDNQLKISRKVNLIRSDISTDDYAAFKIFFSNIVEAESKYVIFK